MALNDMLRPGSIAVRRGAAQSRAMVGPGSPHRIDPGWAQRNPDQAHAAITRADFNRYREFFLPKTLEAIDAASADTDPQADAAGRVAGGAFNNLMARTDRALARTGRTMSGDERAVAERLNSLARGSTIAGAENATRQTLNDRNTQALADLANIGQDISGGASDALSQAAGMQGQREQAGRTMKAQYKQNQLSTGMAAAGALLAFI